MQETSGGGGQTWTSHSELKTPQLMQMSAERTSHYRSWTTALVHVKKRLSHWCNRSEQYMQQPAYLVYFISPTWCICIYTSVFWGQWLLTHVWMSEWYRVIRKNNISGEGLPNRDNTIEKMISYVCIGFGSLNWKFERMAAEVIVGIESEEWVINVVLLWTISLLHAQTSLAFEQPRFAGMNAVLCHDTR